MALVFPPSPREAEKMVQRRMKAVCREKGEGKEDSFRWMSSWCGDGRSVQLFCISTPHTHVKGIELVSQTSNTGTGINVGFYSVSGAHLGSSALGDLQSASYLYALIHIMA